MGDSARRPHEPDQPGERRATVRAGLKAVLREGPVTARELSARVGLSERAVAGELEHLARSLRQGRERLRVEPARCRGCGFLFRKRERLSRPSKCPACKGQHLWPPRYVIVGGSEAR